MKVSYLLYPQHSAYLIAPQEIILLCCIWLVRVCRIYKIETPLNVAYKCSSLLADLLRLELYLMPSYNIILDSVPVLQ